MRRIYLLSMILFFAINLSARNPNVIIILTDDQGWGDLSIYGNTNLNTPNIDELGKSGIILDRFYVQAVCSPTRAEILTGRYHVRSGVYSTSQGGERMNADEITIAKILKDNGYVTALYGKWHSGMQAPYHPNAKGFDDFYGFCSGHWGNYFSPMLEHNGEIVKGEGFLPDDLTNHGLDFMETNKENPFFLFLSYNTPHSPMQVPKEYWERMISKPLEMRNRDSAEEDTLFTKAALAMVENIDDNVGRLKDKIHELDLDSETIVIYLSDNGPNGVRWNGGMKGKKGSTDEGGVRVPMIIKWTDHLVAGIKIEDISSGIDILPTVLDLANINNEYKNPIDGISLKPLLTGQPDSIGRYLFNYWQGRTSVRSQRFRLDDQNNLFDMSNDFGQTTDVRVDFPMEYDCILKAKKEWVRNVASLLDKENHRPITLGYPGYEFHQIPARDAEYTGNIKRSNRWPNCSFLTNWTTLDDEIIWNVDVIEDGVFEVEIYYTCAAENVGSTFELICGNSKLVSKITEAHDPPLMGAENDVYPRMESYVKDFKRMTMGEITLKKGESKLFLKAINIPGVSVMDFRLLMFNRV